MYKPKYTIYILSKGRADTRFTVKTLEELGVSNYLVAIEKEDYPAYSAVIDDKNLLVAPDDLRTNPKWARDCEASGNKAGGGIPMRNFIWEHSVEAGDKRHWIMDDNIRNFYRLHQNKKRPVTVPTIIRLAEEFVDRYKNVGMAGMNYDYFCPSGEPRPPYYLNTRIYSCILLNNEVDQRWRGRFNEDTDLSVRILKDGWCTVLYNAFLAGKITTSTMKGGNNETIYGLGEDGSVPDGWMAREDFADSIVAQHPDIATKVERYRRWHHEVKYDVFTQRLKLKDELVGKIPKGNNEYGMVLKKLDPEIVKARKQFTGARAQTRGFKDKR